MAVSAGRRGGAASPVQVARVASCHCFTNIERRCSAVVHSGVMAAVPSEAFTVVVAVSMSSGAWPRCRATAPVHVGGRAVGSLAHIEAGGCNAPLKADVVHAVTRLALRVVVAVSLAVIAGRRRGAAVPVQVGRVAREGLAHIE